MAFCSQCGEKLVDDAVFCTSCGKPVQKSEGSSGDEPTAAEPTSAAAVPAEPSEPPPPRAVAPPPVEPPDTPTPQPPDDGSGRKSRMLLIGGIAAIAIVVVAAGALFVMQQGDDESDGVVIPVAQDTSEESTTTSGGVATTAPSTTTTTAPPTTTTTLPPSTTTTLPADLVAGIDGAGVFIAAGSTADQASLEASVANARNHDWDLSVIAVPAEPGDGASPYAASIASAMNLGTVVVVSPDSLGWASQEIEFSDREFERAWSLIPPGSSEAPAVHSFVWSVLGGRDSVGVLDPSDAYWLLIGPDGIPNEFTYGDVGDTPLLGDWNYDGIETVGIWRPSDPTVFLRNSNSAGDAAVDYPYNYTGAVPIAGDFDGDGFATISFHIPGEARVLIFNTKEDIVENANSNDESISVDTKYAFGDTGDIAFVGDFDGDGIDTIGLFRPSTGMFYLKNSHTEGPADIEFAFGAAGDIPIAGDWTDQDGIDSVAVYRPSTGTFFFRYSNSAGPADKTLELGVFDALPVAGAFGLDRSG